MELIHRINGGTIEEPIGFDGLECKISRGDYHGMSAEVSVGSLEFYGVAYEIIRDAYESDLDKKLEYTVETADGTGVFKGDLDLSTCSFQDSEYRSVSVKVGEIGVKTTFNNRTETDVNLNTTKTIDGGTMQQPVWLNLNIPSKHLLYTNNFYCKTQKEEEAGTDVKEGTGKHFISVPLPLEKAFEYGVHGLLCRVMNAKVTKPMGVIGDIPYNNDPDMALFREDGEFENKFGEDTVHDIELHVAASIEIPDDCLVDYSAQSVHMTGTKQYTACLALVNEKGTILWQSGNTYMGGGNYPNKLTFYTYDQFNPDEHGAIIESVSTDEQLYLGFILTTDYRYNRTGPMGGVVESFPANATYTPKVTVTAGSYVKMTMQDNLLKENTSVKMITVHDALNVVTKAISENELAVKSSWYGSVLSNWNKETGYGGGSLKVLTNGYKIRGVYDEDRNMPVSFRTLIESLNAQDCIGWGFSTENGTICVRVERWNWFYKTNVVLTISDANNVRREVDTSKIITELKIGYKKYATTEQYNSINSIHGVRTFTSGIKAISAKSERLCSFIADNYAIEEVRRLNGKETEQCGYDENIFVFEIIRDVPNAAGRIATNSIGNTATNATGVGLVDELINAKLSPRHMAARWRSYIFASTSPYDMRFTSGELNYKGSFGVIPAVGIKATSTRYSLATDNTNTIQAENDNLVNEHAAFRAETISFDYPLTISQYKVILGNPYGLVVVNGIKGWIKDFTYKINEGLASFKLIPKYE